MAIKNIETVIAPPKPHWVGDAFHMHNFIPGVERLNHRRMDPFLVLDFGSKHNFPPTEMARGVGGHPHKGFETVTIAYHGSVAHGDSTGASGVIHEGDVQWMTAGSGIVHKEYQAKEFYEKGGIFQVVQLWVNLPAKDKNTPPKYQNITQEDLAKYSLDDEAGTVEVIAGEYKGLRGPASTFSPIYLMQARLNPEGKADFSLPADYTTAMVVIEGPVVTNGERKSHINQFILFGNEGEDFTVEAPDKNALVLIMSGQPLKEPIAAHGPFVMNTREELVNAIDDYNSGEFGYLE